MSSDNNAPSVTNSIPKTTGMAFVTHFIPGLVIGLLVGALATAFVMPLLEREKVNLPTPTPDARTTPPAPDGPQTNPAPQPGNQPVTPAETAAPDQPVPAPSPTPQPATP